MSIVGIDLGIDLGNDGCFVLPHSRGDASENLRDLPYLRDEGLFLQGMCFTGAATRNKIQLNPNSISLIKRLIGRPFSDPELQQDLKSLDILAVEGRDGFPLIDVEYCGTPCRFTPIQIMEFAFSTMKLYAERKFGTTVLNCCIGIPIYFTDFQRRALMDAACNSGLNPLMLMHETTAAAVAYGYYEAYRFDTQQNVAFVDIGHASIQVCIAGFKRGQCEVLAHSFDRCLGLRDFDEVLFQHFVEKLKVEYKIDVLQNVWAEVRLRAECEKLKEILSQFGGRVQMNIRGLMDDKDVTVFITRDEFEEISSPKLERVTKPLENALAEAQLTVDDIIDFQVAGLGSSVPAVINILSKFFGRKESIRTKKSTFVSKGCTLQCAILGSNFNYRKLLVQERFPFSIALKLKGTGQGSHLVIFPKGTPIPCAKDLTFVVSSTFSVDLEYMDFGELKALPTRYTIGPFQATNAERVKVRVNVLLNLHGIVSVDSAQLIEEEEVEVPVTKEPSREATKMETDIASTDCDIEETKAKKNALKAYVYEMMNKLYDKLFEFVTESERVQFIAKLQETEDWLHEYGEDKTKGVYVAKLDELKKQGDPIEQQYKDHVIKETKAKKKALEAYACEMRDKLLDKLSEFVTDSDRKQLIRKLQETLDWLSEDGEDEINVYVAKLYELKKQGDRIEQRYKEHSERDSSLSFLRERADWFKKAASGDPNYKHVDESGRREVLKACLVAERWLGLVYYAKDTWAKHETPVVLLADIRKKVKELDSVCIPILLRSTNKTDAANMEDASMTKNGVVDTGDNSVKMDTDTKTMSVTEEEIKTMKLSLKKKKNLRRNRRKKSHHSQEDREEEPVSSSSSPPPALLRAEIKQLINESLKNSYPKLVDLNGAFVTVKGDALVMHGDDYQCPSVIHICNKLREEEPDLFRATGTEDIAKRIMKHIRKSEIIDQVAIRGGCFVSFKLSWEWMAKRIQTMIEDGIDSWAPIYDLKVIVLEFPTPAINSHSYADAIRSEYIRDSLARMLEFSGVAVRHRVSYTSINCLSEREIAKKFIVQQGEFKKRVDGQVAPTPLFVWSEESRAKRRQYDSVHFDLGSLWTGIHSYQADLIIYITPARQRGYIEKCFDAARDVEWLKADIAFCCGYSTSSNEKEKLACLLKEFRNYSKTASLVELVKAVGYTSTPDAVFESVLRYTYLKTNRLVDCTFSLEEMLDVKGNTFVYLLNTLALVHTIMKTSSQDMFKLNKEFVAKERDLGLHIVRFTDVVEESCSRFLPHLMCEYLYDLCNKFTSCYSEVTPVATRLLLCKATLSVMEKCFYLLQITPEPTPPLLDRFLDTQEDLLNYFIPWPLSNPHRRNNPRLEMVSMNVTMFDRDFDEGRMFGEITVSDTCRLQPHGWSVLYANDNGHISYFGRTWCNALSMKDSSLHFFGNPSSPQLVALASFMEIKAHLMLTCKKKGKGACYTICKTTSSLKLKEFWDDYGLSKCGNKSFTSKDAKVMIFYVLMKDAVDINMDLKFVSPYPDSQGFRVRGHLYAYHGGVLSDVSDADKMFYKSIIYKTDGECVIAGELQLQKSVFAVPANGCLMIEAFFVDVNSGVVIVNETRPYYASPQGSVHWKMPGPKSKFKGKFILTLNWSTGSGIN